LLSGIVVEKQSTGNCLVDCEGSHFPCIAACSLDVGQRVTVALRYEKLNLAKELSSETVISGAVTDRTYLGSAVRIETRLANGVVITADIGDTDHAQRIQPRSSSARRCKTAAVAVVDRRSSLSRYDLPCNMEG
jgi:ABC-type Fe3+/spermidine/putrescine transport system ATPase subunit